MTDQLRPFQGGTFLQVAEIVNRLRSEFSFVNVDHGRGMAFLARRIAQSNPLPPQLEIDRTLGELSETSEIIVADDSHSDRLFLKAFVIPGEPVLVAYCYAGHQEHARPLLARFAAALGYEIE